MSEGHAAKLVVSVEPERREELSDRVVRLLAWVGIPGAEVLAAGKRKALLFIWFPGNAKEPLERLRALCHDQPELFRGTRQWTPIDSWTRADAAHLAAFADEVAKRTPEDQPFDIEIRRDGRVDLEVEAMLPEQQVHPPRAARTLRFEIFGSRAGVVVLEPGDELDVSKAERAKLADDAFRDATRR